MEEIDCGFNMSITDDPLYLEVSEKLDGFRKRYLERIESQQRRLKACKINTEIQSKREQELKLNGELTKRLAELTKKANSLDVICSKFASGLTIAESDQQRLDNAKEMYEIGKKLTGIRFDYSAPPQTIRGYIKSEARCMLSSFEFPAEQAGDTLWKLLQDFTEDKENKLRN